MKTKFLLIITGVLALLYGCGGGGGGDEDGAADDGEDVLLPTYAYSISAIPGGANPFTVTIGDAKIGVDPGNTITGTVDIGFSSEAGFADDSEILLTNRTVAAGSTFSVDSDLGATDVLGTFDVTVVSEIAFAFEDNPDSGELEVVAGTENIHVTVVSGGAVNGGVQLSLNSQPAESFTWSEFDDLLDGAAPDWQKRAALASQALGFIYIRAFDIINVLDLIDDALPGNNPRTEMCAQFPAAFPPGVLAQGMAVLTWLGSGSLQPGDDFDLQLTDCWLDDPFKNRDELLNGTIHLTNYTEVIDDRDRITRIGFEPSQSAPGGVIFDNYKIQALNEISSNGYEFDSGDPPVLDGGFAVVFSEP